MIKGFRFTNQLANAEVDARIHQEFLNKNDGIFYGMELSYTNSSITVSEGLCEIAGRPVTVIDNETVTVETENLYCVLVLEIDLSKESSKDKFEQVKFKILTSNTDYTAVTQQDINKYAGTERIYQLEFARFRSGTSGITDFKDTRKLLNFEGIYEQIKKEIKNIEDGSIYVLKSDCVTLYNDNNGTTENITLSDNYNNYKKFDIYTKEGTIITCYNNSSEEGCHISYVRTIGLNNVTVQLKTQQIFFRNNNVIERGKGRTIGLGGSGQGVVQNIDENMNIIKVVGYKE